MRDLHPSDCQPIMKSHLTFYGNPTKEETETFQHSEFRVPVKDLRNTNLGYGFDFQRRNSRTFPIENPEHDSGHTLVCAEYSYPKGSPNTSS
jgi:hypothetical protein